MDRVREMTQHPDDNHLAALAENNLRPEVTQRLERHLAQCSQCRGTVDELRELLNMQKGNEE